MKQIERMEKTVKRITGPAEKITRQYKTISDQIDYYNEYYKMEQSLNPDLEEVNNETPSNLLDEPTWIKVLHLHGLISRFKKRGNPPYYRLRCHSITLYWIWKGFFNHHDSKVFFSEFVDSKGNLINFRNLQKAKDNYSDNHKLSDKLISDLEKVLKRPINREI